MRFGPNFEWVRGGKLPGLCGAECLTGCKEVSGLDGFSARHMWRPCVWPPVHPDNALNCTGAIRILSNTLIKMMFVRVVLFDQASDSCLLSQRPGRGAVMVGLDILRG
jgi:hypothetical protein